MQHAEGPYASRQAERVRRQLAKNAEKRVGQRRRRSSRNRRWAGANVLLMGDTQPTHEWGKYLRRLTRDRNPTIKDLAERAGISRQTLSEYIRDGAESVTIGIVRAIARAAGDEFINALLAAGNVRRDATDDEIRAVLADDTLDDEQKMLIIQELEAMRATDEQLLENQRSRDRERRTERVEALKDRLRRVA